MLCCGKKRAQLLQTTQASQGRELSEQSSLQGQPKRETVVYYQYIGKKGITVVGRQTQNRYRFDRNGVVVAVDIRDQRALAAVPTLRRLKGQ